MKQTLKIYPMYFFLGFTFKEEKCVIFFPLLYRCAKELNQWELTLEYGRSNAGSDPLLVLESCWHVPNWPLMKDALSHVEQAYPKELAWKVGINLNVG